MDLEAALARAERVAHALGVLFVETGFPVIAIDESGHIVSGNAAAVRQYGYALAELVELRIHDFQAVDRPLEGELERARRESGAAFEPRQHRRKDGSHVWVVPVAGPIVVDGERLIVSSLMDVTAMVAAQARAREAEELAHRARRAAELLWQVAVERLADGVLLLDDERRIVRANGRAAALLGVDAAALLGRRCTEVFPLCRDASPCPHQRAVASGERVLVDRSAAAPTSPLRIEIIPVVPPHAGLASIQVMRDLAEEHAARSELVMNDRLATMGRIAASVAHEVNNPVAYLLLQLELARSQLASGRKSPAEIVPMIDETIASTRQLAQIIRDLTGFVRERGCAPTDLSAAVASALRIAAVETRARAEVESRFEDGVVALVHGARVVQVVLNLVLNAAQAIDPTSPRGQRIVVRTFIAGANRDRACISITDTGPGIPPELSERVFEPFYTTRSEEGGTGIGLWLSRGIVEDEGGSLGFQNLDEGGACFTVELPLYGAPT
jgi:PAS domain S-box-containing protein